MFVPYYMSLFSSFVDISYIVRSLLSKHILINLFMKDGIQFLHRFFLALLLFMKDQLLEAQDDILYLLGNSSLKDMNIPWDQVIVVAQKLTLNWFIIFFLVTFIQILFTLSSSRLKEITQIKIF